MAKLSFIDIFHPESRYPVFERICSHLTIDAIIALTRTCRGLSGLYQSLIPLHWNVDRLLSRFVRDPQFFRTQMGRYNALVSGSLATQFFERVLWKESGLDIYIKSGGDAEAFEKYLTEEEGYKLNTATCKDVNSAMKILESRTYTRRLEVDSAELKARIIFTQDMPLQAILLSSYTTAVVNFFTWNKAYAIFPLPTFVHHKGYLLKPITEFLPMVLPWKLPSMLQKYTRRGWRFQQVMWPEDASSNNPIQETRRIGDEFTWMIPFDTKLVDWSKIPDSVLEYASFGVSLLAKKDFRCYGISAQSFRCEVLRHAYIYGFKEWMVFLKGRVDELFYVELWKLTPEQAWPLGFQGTLTQCEMSGCMDDRCKPDSWSYWDDEIPNWYRAWRLSVAQPKKPESLIT